MNLHNVLDLIIHPAMSLLPERMRSPEADAHMLTIALQESGFEHRVQLIGTSRKWWECLKGPARGGWQFELFGGVRGVVKHPASRPHVLHVLDALRYPENLWLLHQAIAHNDLLAACFARLLLYTDPRPLPPLTASADDAWVYYLRNWRPGKPHRETWDHYWQQATTAVRTAPGNKFHGQGYS